MKINFSQCLADLDGSPLDWAIVACGRCGRARESKPATMRTLCADALVQGYQNEQGLPEQLSGEEHVRRLDLALKIMNTDVLEVTPEDIALIRKLAAKRFTPLFAGQVWKLLNPQEEP